MASTVTARSGCIASNGDGNTGTARLGSWARCGDRSRKKFDIIASDRGQLHVCRPANRTETKHVGFRPAVGARQRVDVEEQALGGELHLLPQQLSAIERRP